MGENTRDQSALSYDPQAFEEVMEDILLYQSLPETIGKANRWENRPRGFGAPIRPISYFSDPEIRTFEDFQSTIEHKIGWLNSLARRFSLNPELVVQVDWEYTRIYYDKTISVIKEYEIADHQDRILWFIANMYPALTEASSPGDSRADHSACSPEHELKNQEGDKTNQYSSIVKQIKRVHEKKVGEVTKRITWLLKRGVLKDAHYYKELLEYLHNWISEHKIAGKFYFLQPELALLERYLVGSTNIGSPGKFILRIFEEFEITDYLFKKMFNDSNRRITEADRKHMVKSINNNFRATKKYSEEELVRKF